MVFVHPVSSVGFEEPKASEAKEINTVLQWASCKRRLSRGEVSIPTRIHPLISCHAQDTYLKKMSYYLLVLHLQSARKPHFQY